MRKAALVLVWSLLAAACASTPEPAVQPKLTQASYSATTAVPAAEQSATAVHAGATECQPNIVDKRAALKHGCLNRIERSPMAGKGYNAIGREIKDLKSLCNQMFLPKCRHKY